MISVDSSKFNSNRDTAVIVWGANGNPFQINHFQSFSSPGTNEIFSHFTTSFTQSNESYAYLGGYEAYLSSYQPENEYNVISKYLGKTPVNLMSSYSFESTPTVNYTYTKDSNGNIISMTLAYTLGNVVTYTFTYNCH